MAAPKITTGYTQPGTKLIVKPNIAKYTDKNGKVSAKYQTDLANFYAKSTDPEAVKYRTDELTKKYGSLKDADGKTIFTPTYIKALAEGVEPPASLDIAVTKWATSKMKEATNYDWDTFKGGIDSATAQKLLSSFVKDPSQVDTALTFKSSGVEFTDDEKKANAIKLQDKTAKAEEGIAALENYDPNAGTWDPSKNTQATPFGDVLSGLISGYKNPYAANYVNPLASVEKPKLTNIQTPFNKNAIPQDLVSLFNSAGTNYAGGTRANPLVRPTLPNNGLVKLTQPSATESAEQLAKPGAPDTTNTQIPVDTGKPPVVTDKPANWGYVKTPEEIAAEKAAADKLVAEQKAIEDARLAAEKAAADKLEADRQAGIKALADKAAADKAAADKAAADKIAADKAAADKAAADKAAADKIAAEKAANTSNTHNAIYPIDPSIGTYTPTSIQPQQVTLDPNTVATPWNGVSIAPSAQTASLPTSGPQPINPSNGGPSSLGPSNNITYGPQQVTLAPDTVVTPSGINTLSAQTVALPTSGPQQVTVQPQPAAGTGTVLAPINPSNGGPSSAITISPNPAQNNLGPLNISNLGAVISPQAMNSTAGGVASLVGPQVTVQPQPAAGTGTVLAPSPSQSQQTIQPSAVVQQPAPISATARNNALLANIAAAMKK